MCVCVCVCVCLLLIVYSHTHSQLILVVVILQRLLELRGGDDHTKMDSSSSATTMKEIAENVTMKDYKTVEHVINSISLLLNGNLITLGNLPECCQKILIYDIVVKFMLMMGPDLAQHFVLNLGGDY